MSAASAARAAACVALAGATYAIAPDPQSLRASLAVFVLVGGLWTTQALPLPVTALLVPVLAVAAGLADPREALAPFAHPIVFLFLGGFALAAALQAQGLDRALARRVLHAAGGRRGVAVVLLALLAAVLSMWISNTATAAMMLPLALGLLRGEDPEPGGGAPGTPGEARGRADASPAPAPAASGGGGAAGADASASVGIGPREQAFVLLALAYSCSIGGMATLVGSPPNAIAAAQAGIGFAQWLAYGLPAAALLWPATLAVLWVTLRPRLGGTVVTARIPLRWTRPRVATAAIFAATVAGWTGGARLAGALGIDGDVDAWVALAALVALVASGALTWRDVESRSQWGVLLLFGGGLALSELMQANGASRFLAEQALTAVEGAPRLLVLAAVVTFVVLLTELVSNTASAALVLPIFLPTAAALGVPVPVAAAAVALAASCAFMLPVATPPNALVYSTERVPQATMMRCGLRLNVVAACVLTALAWLATPG
jgi:sodium-dependent dicarboxylate transporter 2/3/5